MANDLRTFTIQDARRIALSAQGLFQAIPKDRDITLSDFDAVLQRINIVQIDSVNVLVRAQYMPFFSRLGPYPIEMLHQYAYEKQNLYEYYVHQASMIPISQLPMIRYRMDEWKPWRTWSEEIAKRPGMLEGIIDEIKSRGPLEVSDIPNKGERYGHWGITTAKLVLETMLHKGQLSIADRLNTARRYDLFERVVPEHVAQEPPMPKLEAHRKMMELAISSLGVGTLADCADYYRIKRDDAKVALDHLVETSKIERVNVGNLSIDLYAVPGIEPPEKDVKACSIVSPFDPAAWFRSRLEWLFDFEYRIEIYTPAKKRKYGYYVLPFILGDRFVARVDLKADRQASVLRVPGAFLEPDCDDEHVAHDLAAQLKLMADWLQLDRIVIGRRGNLTRSLRAAVKAL